jgi:hypothetical protein
LIPGIGAFPKEHAGQECGDEDKAFSGREEPQRLVGQAAKRRGRMIDTHHQQQDPSKYVELAKTFHLRA